MGLFKKSLKIFTLSFMNKIYTNFDIIAITEPRIKNKSVCPTNVTLPNYSIEQTPTETSASGAVLYINQRLSYQPGTDLKICVPGKLESIFIEITCPKSVNVIVGCLYKHPASTLALMNLQRKYYHHFL